MLCKKKTKHPVLFKKVESETYVKCNSLKGKTEFLK